jgi:hypothetical protein
LWRKREKIEVKFEKSVAPFWCSIKNLWIDSFRSGWRELEFEFGECWFMMSGFLQLKGMRFGEMGEKP